MNSIGAYFSVDDEIEANHQIKGILERAGGFKRVYSIFKSLREQNISDCRTRVIHLERFRRAIEIKNSTQKGILRIAAKKTAEMYFNRIVEIESGKGQFLQAADRGYLELLKIFKRKIGAIHDIFTRSTVVGEEDKLMTPMHFAAVRGHTEVVRWLCENGALVDVAANNPKGWTPLHLAVQRGHGKVVRLLLDFGANVNRREELKGGNTPLHVACDSKLYRLALYLFTRGANPCMREVSRGHKPIDWAKKREKVKLDEAFTLPNYQRKTWLSRFPRNVRLLVYPYIGKDLLTSARQVSKEWNKLIVEDIIGDFLLKSKFEQ